MAIRIEDHSDGKRITVEGPRGTIIVTVMANDGEGFPVVDICPKPRKGCTAVGFVDQAGDETISFKNRGNQQMYVTFVVED